ncbi:MAG: tRNA (N6-isopentenyl adenosine(37)-C2)-methylthiotransferase MiaB [Clostridia bacterium]|nr:tRNA (N6-isopentenyl adenosine(37)-C2)-methylthiotransferase MiaB [Clostridia bacterium]
MQILMEQNTNQQQYIKQLRLWNDKYAAETGARRRAFVLTFGCQQNEADSEKLKGTALAMGYELTEQPAQADLIVVNTCAIREHAELKALSIIGQYKHIKQKHPDLVIAVCGCMPAQESRKNELKNKYPYVDLVFGTTSAHRFPELLHEKLERGKRLFCPEATEGIVVEGIPVKRESSYRAWVSVMYGCNNFCSYCIVPYVRGRERSRRAEDVIAEVRELVESGYRDITLLGQNVNSYGKDLGNGYDFADLLRDVSTIEGDYLLHFMSSHPKDATEKLIDVMATCPHIAPHFHLPMQSGSDRVLKAMNRRYDTEKYYSIVEYMRSKIPGIAITSDIIVGFPGETEEDFEGTLEMLRRVRFDMLYSFIFSPRKGTPADTMPDPVPDAVKSERFSRLLALQNEISLEKNLPLEGKTLRVLCDGVSKTNAELCQGRTDQGKIVFFPCDPARMGDYVCVHIDRADSYALYGTIAEA